MTRGSWTVLGMVALLLVAAGDAGAQDRAPAHLDFSLLAADPVGDLGLFFDQGFGGQIGAAFPLDRTGFVRLRADVGFMVYGIERQTYCFALPFGCRINASLTTSNNFVYGGFGPEIVLAPGRVEPYVFGTMGFAGFFTTSSLGEEDEYGDSFTTTHYSDFNFAWRGGGGLRIQLSEGRKPVSLDFGIERHENGVAEFLTKGDIVDHPNGDITIYPNRSEANLVTFRFGISIGIPR